ncbi:MAG TPA: hypothetical protein PLI79_09090 [Mycobacterium sp.]|nr:hypothetical protein [Mycobacterium sp.]
MQLAFNAAASGDATGGSGALFFEILGFVMFILWLASVLATIVGVWGVKQLQSR